MSNIKPHPIFEAVLKELTERRTALSSTPGSAGVLSLLAIGLTGCGGGGGATRGSSATPTYTQSGFVLKGPLSNASVFIDLNRNGFADSNERNLAFSKHSMLIHSPLETCFKI